MMDKVSEKMTKKFDNPIDREEYQNFERLKKWLKNGIDLASKKSVTASNLRKQYNGNDKNDIPPILEANGTRDISQEDIETYKKALPEPYFARIAYREIYSDETIFEDIYIGKEMIKDDSGYGSEILVHSWASDIANELLYNRTVKPYEKMLKKRADRPFDDDKKYVVYPDLRRMILSEKGKYIKHINEYVSEEYVKKYNYGAWIEAGEQISDQFLRDVLEQKKEESQITNIIRTIQQNQNTVIRLPLNENFIVEGCAGSGKTMIMLHRLSYLGERESQLNEMKIEVLTPSEDFNEQMRALSEDLNLNKVSISSVGQYYRTLLKKIDWIGNSNSKLRDDIELPIVFVQKMYSMDMLNMMRRVSTNITNKALDGENAIHSYEIELHVKKLGIDDKVKYMHYDKIDELIAILDAIITEDENLIKLKESYEKDRDTFAQRIYKLGDKYALEEEIYQAKNEIEKYMNELSAKIDKQYSKAKTKTDKDFYKDLQGTILLLLSEINFDDKPFVEQLKDCAKKVNKNKVDKTLDKMINKYDSAIVLYKNSEHMIENNKNQIVDLTMKIIDIENTKLSEKNKSRLESYRKELKQNKVMLGDYKQTFERYIFPYVEDQCKQYKVKFNQNYKFYMYLKLWWYHLNGGNQFGKYMMCIDEAQNISITEYKLLSALHGPRTIFNIYGDLLQNTRKEIGLTAWAMLQSELFSENVQVYTFAENYRNTNQITEYVNKKLNLPVPMKKIGYDGASVQYYSRGLHELFRNLKNKTDKTAVIFPKLTKEIISLAEQYELSVGKVNNEGASVLAIDDVKGLEFHTVYVIDQDLSKNEKYIAYTRALKQLYIVNAH